MNFNQYSKAFRSKSLEVGYSSDLIERSLQYANVLFEQNVPVIYSTSHFSSLVGYKKNYIKNAVTFPTYYYSDYKIRKSGGGYRTINEPLPNLKEIQKWILHNILKKIEISNYAKAYRSEFTIKDHLKYHRRQNIVITCDIEDFFGSIKKQNVEVIFNNLGYSNQLSNLLAKLTTLNDSLPQGAPTSPCISNIYLKGFDENLAHYCKKNKIRYTRYADDMAFSGSGINVEELLKYIRHSISNFELNLNESKTKVMEQNVQQVICNVVVNQKTQVEKKYRDKIRQEIHYMKLYGLENHMSHSEISNANYTKHLLGKINYVLFINPKDKKMIEYKDYLHNLI